MNLHLIWTAVAAAFFVLLFDQACVRIRETVRSRRYEVQRKRRGEIFSEVKEQFNFPTYSTQQRAEGLLDLVLAEHADAIGAQDAYQRKIVRSAACLGFAFAALAANVTLVHDLPQIKTLLAWIDLVALGFSVFHFTMARRALSKWTKLRSRTELLRQYVFLSLLFPSFAERGTSLDLTSAFDEEKERIARQVLPTARKDLVEAIVEFWDKKRNAITTDGNIQDIRENILRLYLDRRCLRQLAWFRASRERAQRIDEDRTRLLSFLFWLSVALTLLKVIVLSFSLQLNPTVVELLAFAVLMATGGAATVSALYFGQNIRSLIHRYRTQEREIEHWLKAFSRFYRDAIRDEMHQGSDVAELRETILRFEDTMIKELADWIHISQHDSIELGP